MTYIDMLKDEHKQGIAEEILLYASEAGFLEEVREVLESAGFDLPDRMVKVKLEFEIEVPFGTTDLEDGSCYAVEFTNGDISVYPDDVNVDETSYV